MGLMLWQLEAVSMCRVILPMHVVSDTRANVQALHVGC